MKAIENRIEELKRRAAERKTQRYPQSFRDDAADVVDELRAKGWTQKAVSDALGIPWVTLARWRWIESEKSQQKDQGFRPVEVIDEDGATGPVLVSPSGWRIEGLSAVELVDVARRLS